MRYLERQKRLERKTYSALEELEDEFQIELKEYPEVIWLGRLGKFDDLGLSERYRDSVESMQRSGGSIYLYRPGVIVLNKYSIHHVNEEAAHYFHLKNSKITLTDKNKQDWFAINILIEMFGFLGSKVLNPSRKNPYREYPDYLDIVSKTGATLQEALGPLKDLDEDSLSEFLIHSQGYMLAERIYCALNKGDISKKRIRNFVLKNFKKPGQAKRQLINFRREFC